jgi:DNA-binding response OmpR family regulator
MKNPVILLVEDNTALLESLEASLAPQYEVHTAVNGIEALDMLRAGHKPDLVVLDMMLPFPIDGFEVLQVMKKHKTLADIPVIMMSAMNYEEKITRSLELGAQDFIVKPFKINHLLLKIQNLLSLRSAAGSQQAGVSVTAESKKDAEQYFRNRFEQICDRLLESPHTPVQEMADELAMSVSTLERWVQRLYQVTPKRFLLDRKLDYAELLLLRQSGSVKSISIKLGFSSVPYFCFCFKNRFGCSPKQHTKKKQLLSEQ